MEVRDLDYNLLSFEDQIKNDLDTDIMVRSDVMAIETMRYRGTPNIESARYIELSDISKNREFRYDIRHQCYPGFATISYCLGCFVRQFFLGVFYPKLASRPVAMVAADFPYTITTPSSVCKKFCLASGLLCVVVLRGTVVNRTKCCQEK